MKRKSLLFLLLMALFAPLAMNGQTTLLSQNFDGNGLALYDNTYDSRGWYTYNAGSGNNWELYQHGSSSAHSGNYDMCYAYDSDNAANCYLVSEPFNVSASISQLSVSLYEKVESNRYAEAFEVFFVKASDVTSHTAVATATQYSAIASASYTNTDWAEKTGSIASSAISALAGQSVRVVVHCTSAKDRYRLYIDDITVTQTSTAPYIVLSPSSATVITGSTQTLTATYGNVSGTPTITYSSSNTNVATVSGSGTTATVTGVAAGTATITATMNGTYTATCVVTVENPSYCTPGTGNYDNDGIYNVTFGTNGVVVNNTVSGIAYGDYSNLVGAVDAGTNDFEVAITYKTGYTYGTIIWVDWNKNYTFEGATEVVYAGQSGSTNPTTLTATFDIPSTTAAGDYRMRIIGADMALDSYTGSLSAAANVDPCGSFNYSTCHDYTLRVIAGAYHITCATPDHGTLSADKNSADENEVITITATPETDYLLTALTYTPEGGSAQSIDITNMPYTFTMPAANVTVNATFTQPNCPKPTNLSVSNLAASHATVSWDSEAGNYTVRYSTATVTGTTLDPVFEDGFEDGLGNWTTYANGTSAESTDWQQYTGTFSGGSGGPHTGSYVAMSRSWSSETGDISVDNWLVSPQMTLGNTLKFWVITSEGYPESYAVYVSTGSGVVPSSGTGDFQVVANLTPATGTWTEMTYDISAYAGQQGYVAIRHKDSSKDHLLVDDFGVYNTINTYSYGSWTTVTPNPTTESCQITGLSAETLYEVQVQANCGGTDGSSAWSTIHFTTPDNCGAPQELATSNITAATATLSWADDKDSYNLQYRKVYFHEGFESETMPAGWTTVDSNSDGLCWQIGSSTAHSGVNGVCNSSFVYDSEFSLSTTPDDYLISPQLDLQGTLRVWLSGYPRSSSNYSEHFEILLSTTGTSVSDFTTTLVTESTTTNSYVEYTADLSSYTGKGYIAIHHFNCTNQNYLYVDDFGIYGSENWVTLSPNPTTETANLTGLTPIIENGNHLLPTTYEWQVQGINCDGNGGTTEWSTVATFSTLEGYTKPITGYGTGNGNWYLIASPIGQVNPENVGNLINDNGYDLYRFNQNAVLEWENYKGDENLSFAGGFNLESGKGYLYANKEDVQLVFTGSAYTGTNTFDLTYSEDNSDAIQHGWNLVGNPFATSASVNQSFCTLNNTSDGISTTAVNAGGTIGAMEGVFVKATGTGQSVTFTQGGAKKSRSINIDVTRNGEFLDRAIVSLSTDGSLCKLSLSDNTTKVYFRQDQKDYAIITSENENEMPVSFKASRNGNYTITVNAEEVEFNYLHLIDNLTGNDVDLLANPNYSFDAKTTDYASRFKLVFVCGSSTSSDTFAFFSNGGFIINNDGNATLQVIDINGRIIKSESINGCANVNVNAATGVYMLRLINGDNVKTQKVVVK